MGAASLATASVVGAVLFYSKLSGSSYPSLLLYLGAASLAEIAVYVVYHSLVYRWFFSATKSLPHPKASFR